MFRTSWRANERASAHVLLAAIGLVAAWTAPADAAVFVVNSTGNFSDAVLDGVCDTGNLVPNGAGGFEVECTLRAAIVEAENTVARDQVHFSSDLPYGNRGTAVISVPGGFQNLDNPIDIDATTAPSWNPEGYPRVLLQGPGTGAGIDGLRLRQGASDSTIKGLAFQDFRYGVVLAGADAVQVDACAFGYWIQPPTQSFPFLAPLDGLGGNINGVRIESQSVGSIIGRRVILGGFPALDPSFSGQGNVFAANTWAIVNHADDTSIVGNMIGVGLDGEQTTTVNQLPASSLGNDYGIWATNISGLDVGRVILPLAKLFEASGNVISNNEYGIYIDEDVAVAGSPASIVANKIGTDVEGLLDRGNDNYGIHVVTARSTISIGSGIGGGNVIAANGTDGIDLQSLTLGEVNIQNNLVGLGEDGSTALGNGSDGIHVEGGTPLTIANNIVGNSGDSGIELAGPWFAALYDATIEGNHVGTNPDGEDHGNVGDGIEIEHDGTPAVEIAGNVVGFNYRGIYLGEKSEEVVVVANLVGTDTSGANLGNEVSGIRSTSLDGGHAIGRVGEGNVIGWNGTHGIRVDNATATSEIVANAIGETIGGIAVPNGRHGVSILPGAGAATPVTIGSDLSTPAVDYTGRENVIRNNGLDGITVGPDGWATIRANRIGENADLAIDLGNDDATANDLGDFDLGANALQNHPELDEAGSSHDFVSGELTMEYRVPSFDTESDYDLRVDFYLTDASGAQPDLHVGEDVYPAIAANTQRAVTFFPTQSIPIDAFVVATATDASGRTSEVSLPVFVPEPSFAAGLGLGVLGLGALRSRRDRDAASAERSA